MGRKLTWAEGEEEREEFGMMLLMRYMQCFRQPANLRDSRISVLHVINASQRLSLEMPPPPPRVKRWWTWRPMSFQVLATQRPILGCRMNPQAWRTH